uniref:Uncharacterized protein n=1 Tax=Fundulus heteroclitus TaxID=8078 RepID=A0A3Q2P2T1_FUNHE
MFLCSINNSGPLVLQNQTLCFSAASLTLDLWFFICRCSGSSPSEVSTATFSVSDRLRSSTGTPSLSEEHPVRTGSGSGSSDGSTKGSCGSCRLDEAPGSADPPDGSSRRTTERVEPEIRGSGSSSTHRDQNQEMDRSPGTGAVRSSRTCQHLPGPSSRFSQQLSAEPSCQNHYPFPSRRTPKRSEAARRLGLYSSF